MRHRKFLTINNIISKQKDIDILLLGDDRIDCPELTVPHKLMYERDFVMIPLNEIIKYKL